MSKDDVQLATLISFETNDLAVLTATPIVLTNQTIKTVNKCSPVAGQSITLPSAAALEAGGSPPGSRFLFVNGGSFPVTITPNAANTIFGFAVGANSIILQPGAGLGDAVEYQQPVAGGTVWTVTAQRHSGRSTLTVNPAGGTTTLLAATIAETVVILPTVGTGTVTLPAIAVLLAAGYPPGFEFTLASNGAQVIHVNPDAADTFLAQAAPRDFAATAVAHFITVRLPVAGPGAWTISSVSPT